MENAMPAEPAKIRRIIMALDTASSALPAIEAAAGLALGLDAELAGLFIEDERLLRFAGLPFARETGFASARARPLAPASVEHALRAQAEQLRRLLAATAERLSLAWTLEVVRGEVLRSVLERVGASDLLVLGRSEYSWPGAHRRFDRAQRFPALAARPVAVVFDGSATALHALSIGSTFARITESELSVLIPVIGPQTFDDLRLRAAQRLIDCPGASYVGLPESGPESIIRLARSRHFCVLLWPGRIEDLTPAQLSQLPCPVVLIPSHSNHQRAGKSANRR
jgi:nucleotide-binding universal stress UspA family protein